MAGRWYKIVRISGFFLAALTAACGSHAAPSPSSFSPSASSAGTRAATPVPKQLTWASTPSTWSALPEIVAQGKGFYAAENLTVTQVVTQQSALGCQQVLARAADIAGCNLNDMAQAVEAGNAPLIQFFGAFAIPPNQSAVAKPAIKTWGDLRGKTVIVGGPKDNTAYFFRVMARANGLKDSDYTFQYAGSSSARYAALKAGAVDAAILVDPYDAEAVRGGDTKLDVLVPKYVNADNYGYMAAAVNKDWAKAHADELARYIRAELNAVAWIDNPVNKQDLFVLVSPKLNLDQATFDRLYQRDVIDAKFWSTTGRITDAGVQGVLDSLVDLGSLKQPTPPPGKYYDLSYVNLALAGMKH